MRRFLLAVPVLAVAATLLAAQPSASTETKAFTIDKVHSSALFRIKHLGASYVWGRFNDLKGEFTLSGDAANPLSVKMQIMAESVDTNNAARDKHLRSPDFFNATEFPTLSFKSSGSKKLAGDRYQVTGTLSIHGVSKPLTAELEVLGPVDAGQRGTLAGFETTFTIKRTDFGMDYMVGPNGLGDDVRVVVAVEGGLKSQ